MPKTYNLSINILEHDRPKRKTDQAFLIVTDTIYLGPRTVLDLSMETHDGDLMTLLQKAKRQVELAISELEDSV